MIYRHGRKSREPLSCPGRYSALTALQMIIFWVFLHATVLRRVEDDVPMFFKNIMGLLVVSLDLNRDCVAFLKGTKISPSSVWYRDDGLYNTSERF